MAANRMPAADVGVSELVRCLLADQHPDLARLPVEFLANGWDNELYRVGDGLIARLPRRALGAHHRARAALAAQARPAPAAAHPHAGTDRDTCPRRRSRPSTRREPGTAAPPARTTSRPRTPASSRLPSTKSSACPPLPSAVQSHPATPPMPPMAPPPARSRWFHKRARLARNYALG